VAQLAVFLGLRVGVRRIAPHCAALRRRPKLAKVIIYQHAVRSSFHAPQGFPCCCMAHETKLPQDFRGLRHKSGDPPDMAQCGANHVSERPDVSH
jgi:hypothetical protein